jgi:hypothetical protein
MLKQRKTGPFDEQLSPDGSHYLSKLFLILNYLLFFA